MRSLVAILCLGIFLAGTAFSQTPAAATSLPNTVYVSAEGHFDAAPDTAVISFNISAQENSAKNAYQRAARDAEQIRGLLRSAGVDPAQAQFGYFALTPVFDYRQPKRKIVAYRVYSNVTVKLKDFSKVAPIVEQLATLDVTQNQTLNYTLEDTDTAKVKAVNDAFQRARAEAGGVATAGGRTLGEITYAAVDTEERVAVRQTYQLSMQTRAATANEAPTEEFTPHTVTVTARVNAVFALR
jgi:uncharacterized protein YggE